MVTAVAEEGVVLLTGEDLSQTYDGQKYQFRNIGLTIARGAKLGLVGNNGCGKSTLLKVPWVALCARACSIGWRASCEELRGTDAQPPRANTCCRRPNATTV